MGQHDADLAQDAERSLVNRIYFFIRQNGEVYHFVASVRLIISWWTNGICMLVTLAIFAHLPLPQHRHFPRSLPGRWPGVF
jgi:hypothetical protein